MRWLRRRRHRVGWRRRGRQHQLRRLDDRGLDRLGEHQRHRELGGFRHVGERGQLRKLWKFRRFHELGKHIQLLWGHELGRHRRWHHRRQHDRRRHRK
jgi:hypothetical protein